MRSHEHVYSWPETTYYDYVDKETGERHRLVTPAGERRDTHTGMTKAECDARVNAHHDDRYVETAAAAAKRDDWYRYHRKDSDVYSQVVRILRGEHEDILNEEGNPSMSATAKRLRLAIERYRASHPDN